jgi:hypothetical protein
MNLKMTIYQDNHQINESYHTDGDIDINQMDDEFASDLAVGWFDTEEFDHWKWIIKGVSVLITVSDTQHIVVQPLS